MAPQQQDQAPPLPARHQRRPRLDTETMSTKTHEQYRPHGPHGQRLPDAKPQIPDEIENYDYYYSITDNEQLEFESSTTNPNNLSNNNTTTTPHSREAFYISSHQRSSYWNPFLSNSNCPQKKYSALSSSSCYSTSDASFSCTSDAGYEDEEEDEDEEGEGGALMKMMMSMRRSSSASVTSAKLLLLMRPFSRKLHDRSASM